jgi:hypothetical protein
MTVTAVTVVTVMTIKDFITSLSIQVFEERIEDRREQDHCCLLCSEQTTTQQQQEAPSRSDSTSFGFKAFE